jgi:hypothetical protein
MVVGAAFSVKMGGLFTATSSAATRVGGAVVIDDPRSNGDPQATLLLTHNWNPPGVPGTYHNKRSALRYDGALGRWTVLNLDGTSVADNVSFNIHRGY